MKRSFDDRGNLPIISCPNLLERDTLRRLEILVTNECNLRCRYCYAHGGTYGKKVESMSPKTARTYLQSLLIGRYKSVSSVMFFGGEPTLCPDTIQAVCEFFKNNVNDHVFDKMPDFVMVSNGTLIDENMAQIIHRYDIGVTVSIDGPQEINDLNRIDMRGKGAYARAVQGLKNLIAIGTPPRLIEATYTAKHLQMGYSKEDIYDYLKGKFDTDVLVTDCESGGDEDLTFIDFDLHIRNGEMPLSDIENMSRRLASETVCGISCDVALGSVTLLPNGDLYPCHYFIEHSEYKLAYFKDGTFDFSSYANIVPQFIGLNKLTNPRCANCWAKAVCTLCPAFALLHGAEMDQYCRLRKYNMQFEVLQCAKKFTDSGD